MSYTYSQPSDFPGIVSVIKAATNLNGILVATPTVQCGCLAHDPCSCWSPCPVGDSPMRNLVVLRASYAYTPFPGTMGGLMPASPLTATVYMRTH
jgi:hypothetical protein